MKKEITLIFLGLITMGQAQSSQQTDTDYAPEKIKTTSKTYYYLSSVKSLGAIENIDYKQSYKSGEQPAVYAQHTGSKIKVSKKTGGFSLEVRQAYPESITALWVDWDGDGYFYNNYYNDKTDPNDELVEPLLGKPKNYNYGELKVFVKIPEKAKIGITRMRLQNTWNGDSKYEANIYPVGDMGNSSIRDFDIEITD